MIKINSIKEVKENDEVIYMHPTTEKMVQGRVLGTLDPFVPNVIMVELRKDILSDLVDIIETDVFLVERKENCPYTCTCGASHTSMPNYHLSYCDVN